MNLELKYALLDIKDGIGFITINNAEKRNAITPAVADDLITCIDECSINNDVRAVVLRGAGGNFCGGGDVKNMKAAIDNPKPAVPTLKRLNELSMRLRSLRKPTVAYIEGSAAGAGVSIAMTCDFSIAAEDTKFVFAFVNMGLIPDMGCTHLVTRAVGTVKATELFMTGKLFTGAEARDWGLITDAVPADQLEEAVMKIAKKLAKGPTVSYGYIKTMITRASFSGLEVALDNEKEYQENCRYTEDHAEGVNAFLEKRKPEFKGR